VYFFCPIWHLLSLSFRGSSLQGLRWHYWCMRSNIIQWALFLLVINISAFIPPFREGWFGSRPLSKAHHPEINHNDNILIKCSGSKPGAPIPTIIARNSTSNHDTLFIHNDMKMGGKFFFCIITPINTFHSSVYISII
jgi:hypothetical protein